MRYAQKHKHCLDEARGITTVPKSFNKQEFPSKPSINMPYTAFEAVISFSHPNFRQSQRPADPPPKAHHQQLGLRFVSCREKFSLFIPSPFPILPDSNPNLPYHTNVRVKDACLPVLLHADEHRVCECCELVEFSQTCWQVNCLAEAEFSIYGRLPSLCLRFGFAAISATTPCLGLLF